MACKRFAAALLALAATLGIAPEGMARHARGGGAAPSSLQAITTDTSIGIATDSGTKITTSN